MSTGKNLYKLRNKLWSQVKDIQGVVTVGVGTKRGKAALVIFVDETIVNYKDLPDKYANMPVTYESVGQAKAYGG